MVSCVSTRTIECFRKFVLITKQGSVVQRPNNPNGVNGDHGVNVQRLVEGVLGPNLDSVHLDLGKW